MNVDSRTTRTGVMIMLQVAAMLAACTGTDVGNPRVDIDFALYDADATPGQASEVAGKTARALPPGVSIKEAWVAVDRIRLRDAAACDGNAEIELAGPFAIDMLASGGLDMLRGLDIPARGYCRFEFRWRPADQMLPATAPADLAGAALLFTGMRGDGTAFLLRSERNDERRLDARQGEFAVDTALQGLLVGLDTSTLFSGVDLDGAVAGSDGTIRIEPGSNETLLDAFDGNVAEAIKLYGDADGNGLLDPGEHDSDDVLAE